MRDVHAQAFFGEPAPQQRGHLDLVLDYQDAHGGEATPSHLLLTRVELHLWGWTSQVSASALTSAIASVCMLSGTEYSIPSAGARDRWSSASSRRGAIGMLCPRSPFRAGRARRWRRWSSR